MLPPMQSPYENKTQALLMKHTREVARFTKGYEQLVEEGKRYLRSCQATGYNILHNAQDMDITSPRDLIFYSEAIYNPQHFGALLTTMEQEGLIQPHQVGFGVRSSTVIASVADISSTTGPKPGWQTDADQSIIDRECPGGKKDVARKLDFVETVVTFSPDTKDQGRKIAKFLDQRTRRKKRGAIKYSPEHPDIRATRSLQYVLLQDRFALVRANIFSLGEAQLIVLRQRSCLGDQSWKNEQIVIDRNMTTYLARFDVAP
jgi:hypothetical protein